MIKKVYTDYYGEVRKILDFNDGVCLIKETNKSDGKITAEKTYEYKLVYIPQKLPEAIVQKFDWERWNAV